MELESNSSSGSHQGVSSALNGWLITRCKVATLGVVCSGLFTSAECLQAVCSKSINESAHAGGLKLLHKSKLSASCLKWN